MNNIEDKTGGAALPKQDIKRAILDICNITYRRKDDMADITFNMIFIDTGEIRQKRRSMKWLMKRVFYHELRTWKKNYGEIVKYDKEK